MKRKLLWAVKLLCVIAAVAVVIGLLQEYVFCHADHNRQRIKGFWLEEPQSLDVVYLGASEVYSDIAPGYAYERDGVTGYLFATQANTILNYKSQLKNILSRQKNALVVIEINGALYDEEDLTKEAALRNYSDNVPLDFTKVEWVSRNVGDNKLEYLFPFIKYHSKWGDPDTGGDSEKEELYRSTIADDKKRGYTYLKGVLNNPFRFPAIAMYKQELQHSDEKLPLNEDAEEALRDLLGYCRDEGLTNVVFARFPVVAVEGRNADRYKRIATAGEIIEEYGFDFLNFAVDFDKDIGLDLSTDFYNEEHLNVDGQKKFTAYMTDYLKEHYGLTSHDLSEKQQEEWETCADYYDAYVKYNEAMRADMTFSEISENRDLIKELEKYLPEEGAVRVSLTADGKTETVSTSAATVGELLDERKITVDADDEISVPADTALTDGMEIAVRRVEVKNVVVNEVIPFITKEVYSDELPEGESEITREGVDGETAVTYRVRTVDGTEVSREKIAEKRIRGAVPQITTVGTGTDGGDE